MLAALVRFISEFAEIVIVPFSVSLAAQTVAPSVVNV